MCSMCSLSLHASCIDTGCSCRANDHSQSSLIVTSEEVDEDAGEVRGGPKRAYRREATLRDPQSTGRKRAAVLFPLNREAPCEWKSLANCGGNIGVLGCTEGLQQARHHGPDKSVVNNEVGNVHRICHACHNRWHRSNDSERSGDYDWANAVSAPHSPRAQTAQEQAEALINHLSLKGKKLQKIVD